MLEYAEFRRVFRTFLEEKHCQENLDFLEAVEEYQNEGYKEQSPLRIYQDFVKDGADFQVNLDGKTISSIETKISGLENQDRQNSELLRFVFQDAVEVISNLVAGFLIVTNAFWWLMFFAV